MPGVSSAVSFDISWIGANGYTMSGSFSYDDGMHSGIINGTQIDTLMIEGFHNSTSISSWNLADGSTTTFNFNFDTDSETFLIGGSSLSPTGQAWNWKGATGLGFVSGSPNELFSLDWSSSDDEILDSLILTDYSTLTATRTVVPVPAAAYLFGAGLLWLFGIARRKAA